MTKLTLVNPKSPFLIDDAVFPPLGLLYLADNDTVIVDLAVSDKIPESQIYGFTATTPQINAARRCARDLNGIKILGGSHISAVKDLPDEFDAGILGPCSYEQVIKLSGGISLGHWQATKPNRDVIDLTQYKYVIDSELATTMLTSFGCPFRCAFCSKPVWGRDVLYQPYQMVEQEIDDIQRLGFSGVMIFDDNFLLHPKFKSIAMLFQERKMVYRCFTNASFLDEDIVKWLSMTGCKEVGLGIESGSNRILKIIGKPSNSEQNLKAVGLLQKQGIRVKGFIIVGLPGESGSTIQETDKFLERAELDDVDITTLVPYPASLIWERRDEYDVTWEHDSFWDSSWYKGIPGQYQSMVRTESLSEEQISDARKNLESKYKTFS